MESGGGLEEAARRVYAEEAACPRRAVETVVEAVKLFIPKARVYVYRGEQPLLTLVVVIPRRMRRGAASLLIARHAEERGVDLYSSIDLVVLHEDERDLLFVYSRDRLVPVEGVLEELGCQGG